MYYIFETHANPSQTSNLEQFFTDTSHQFIGIVVLLLGIVVGIANITRSHYLRLLRQTSEQLKLFSEWLLGKELLHKSLANPETLQLRRCERTILFTDIRGFTAWSEQNSPETVVNLLQKYYSVIEHVAKEHHVIKFKLSADEAMLIFADASDAITAARDLQLQTLPILESAGLGVGIGINQGIVVEGLLGSSGVMFYDVIGDTVNTAKRIESSAKKGEILIESTLFAKTGLKPNQEKMREIIVKGKSSPIIVYSVS